MKNFGKSLNDHLPANTAKKVKPYGFDFHMYLRPCLSDVLRVKELRDDIYLPTGYLLDSIEAMNSLVLIDIGANIGTSTLSLITRLPNIYNVYAIEAESENYKMLSKNFNLWESNYKSVKFNCINAIATSSSDDVFQNKSTMKGAISKSGTWQWQIIDSRELQIESKQKVVSIGELIRSEGLKDVVIKVDIEGGEMYLFKEDTEWLRDVVMLSIEIHDRFNIDMISSSSSLIGAISKYDFAMVPEKDIIHFINRKKILENVKNSLQS